MFRILIVWKGKRKFFKKRQTTLEFYYGLTNTYKIEVWEEKFISRHPYVSICIVLSYRIVCKLSHSKIIGTFIHPDQTKSPVDF